MLVIAVLVSGGLILYFTNFVCVPYMLSIFVREIDQVVCRSRSDLCDWVRHTINLIRPPPAKKKRRDTGIILRNLQQKSYKLGL